MSKPGPIARESDRKPTMAAESSLAKDWLTPEEDEAWASS
jgi:hypothetical protein